MADVSVVEKGSEPGLQRKLAAIMFTDIYRYKIPSLYPPDPAQPIHHPAPEPAGQGYRIKKVTDLPVNYLSPQEMIIAAAVFFVVCIGALAYLAAGVKGFGYILPFVMDNKIALTVLVVLLMAMMVYFYATKSVRIVFDDIRAVDRLLDYLAAQIGYTRQVDANNTVVFKPSLYHFIMYSARRITAVFDGSAVMLTGNFMYIRKLVKMIHSFETRA